jgi:hypothetical protein
MRGHHITMQVRITLFHYTVSICFCLFDDSYFETHGDAASVCTKFRGYLHFRNISWERFFSLIRFEFWTSPNS